MVNWSTYRPLLADTETVEKTRKPESRQLAGKTRQPNTAAVLATCCWRPALSGCGLAENSFLAGATIYHGWQSGAVWGDFDITALISKSY